MVDPHTAKRPASTQTKNHGIISPKFFSSANLLFPMRVESHPVLKFAGPESFFQIFFTFSAKLSSTSSPQQEKSRTTEEMTGCQFYATRPYAYPPKEHSADTPAHPPTDHNHKKTFELEIIFPKILSRQIFSLSWELRPSEF